MADVNPVSRLVGEERGQLFLVTALAIAVMLVSLALVLNTAIYTENIATRTTDTQLDDAASGQHAVVAASGKIMDAENRNGTDASKIESRFNSSISNWSETAETLEAGNGFSVGVSYTGDSTTGYRLHQDDTSRNFIDASGGSNWTLTTDERVRGVQFNVTRSNLSTSYADAFRLDIDDGGDPVTVSMYTDNNTSNVFVTVENNTLNESCTVEPVLGDSLVVDVSERTVGTHYCEPLEIVHEDINGDADIKFENGNNATGTYEMYVTDDSGVLDLSLFDIIGSGGPVAQPALYDANVTFVFHSSGTTVEKEIRIAPGEL